MASTGPWATCWRRCWRSSSWPCRCRRDHHIFLLKKTRETRFLLVSPDICWCSFSTLWLFFFFFPTVFHVWYLSFLCFWHDIVWRFGVSRGAFVHLIRDRSVAMFVTCEAESQRSQRLLLHVFQHRERLFLCSCTASCVTTKPQIASSMLWNC